MRMQTCVVLGGLSAGLLAILSTSGAFAADDGGGWIAMFDGKTLEGWKAGDNPESWSAKEGSIVGDGERSHLFYMLHECGNCEFKAEVRINHGGNSGMYFRAKFGPDWPHGYEAQVNNTHEDWRRTGSLYGFFDIKEQLIPDDTWWTQQVIASGIHIVIKVNGKTVVDYVDAKNTYQKGLLALQQHNKGSVVEFRNLMMRPLPAQKP